MELGLAQYRQIRAGYDPSESADDEGLGLTLIQGFDLALSPDDGKYALDTERAREVRRARDRILDALSPSLLWTDVRPRHYRALWRAYLRHRAKWMNGWRMAEIAVSVVAAIGNWLLDEEHIDAFRPPKRGWRAELRKEWEAETKQTCKPARPRHSDEEMEIFWRGLADPGGDPRLLWAAELGAEYRIGQVLRCDRSDLDLSPGAGAGDGTLVIHGRGRKPGATVYLTPGQRKFVDATLGPGGHLAEYEEALQGGRIADYPLFPAGRIVGGLLKLSSTPAGRMTRRNILQLYTDYEASLGIEHVHGRAFYGIRRRSSDRMRRVTSCERVRDAGGGWTAGSPTRERIYMDGADPEVLTETAIARERARGRDLAKPEKAEATNLSAVLRSMGLPEEKVRALVVIAGTGA